MLSFPRVAGVSSLQNRRVVLAEIR